MGKVFIIAEAGVNHNGDINLAYKLIDAAYDAGVDAVKFQTFKSDKLVTSDAEQADYQKKNIGKQTSQLEMLRALELTREDHFKIMSYCKEKGILFLSTAFDDESVDLLHDLDISIWKIPSGEITNLPYLRRLGSFGKKIILSTGMSTLEEVGDALDILMKAGASKKDITVLHCSTAYPAPIDSVNLNAMLTLKNTFNVSVGYSDHTIETEVSIAAVALGASVIEKHFTLDKNMEGPDHKASLEPDELISFVKAIRNVEMAMGDGIKRPTKIELKNRIPVRKSIVLKYNVLKGELLSEDKLTSKRPSTGVSPMMWDNVVGTVANKNLYVNEQISLEDISND